MGQHSAHPKSGRKLLRAGVTGAVLAAAVAGTAGPAFASTAAPVDSAPAVAPASVAGTSVGATALRSALTQQGKPYAWGAAGPNAYDCSGLVQWAFKQAGVDLPHSSSAQSTLGTPVAQSQLQPGDLVFFYTPVSHVGIYVGDGKIVHASTSGQPVKVSSMAGMPFHNASRL
ncbi:NlpC/P60 family protein [Amycolatopsis thermophila]|uniref:Cell wall-associated NlpC family hydrolase n=1 Tax=Amycolatopsis thermophila TaxID=206084 RepID=A0ABU0F4V2_9PSEU|nr:cell wall-associated NlpC family hydrolase [Amycolatopsis thermophila]